MRIGPVRHGPAEQTSRRRKQTGSGVKPRSCGETLRERAPRGRRPVWTSRRRRGRQDIRRRPVGRATLRATRAGAYHPRLARRPAVRRWRATARSTSRSSTRRSLLFEARALRKALTGFTKVPTEKLAASFRVARERGSQVRQAVEHRRDPCGRALRRGSTSRRQADDRETPGATIWISANATAVAAAVRADPPRIARHIELAIATTHFLRLRRRSSGTRGCRSRVSEEAGQTGQSGRWRRR